MVSNRYLTCAGSRGNPAYEYLFLKTEPVSVKNNGNTHLRHSSQLQRQYNSVIVFLIGFWRIQKGKFFILFLGFTVLASNLRAIIFSNFVRAVQLCLILNIDITFVFFFFNPNVFKKKPFLTVTRNYHFGAQHTNAWHFMFFVISRFRRTRAQPPRHLLPYTTEVHKIRLFTAESLIFNLLCFASLIFSLVIQ